jgi:hypothetical protein
LDGGFKSYGQKLDGQFMSHGQKRANFSDTNDDCKIAIPMILLQESWTLQKNPLKDITFFFKSLDSSWLYLSIPH